MQRFPLFKLSIFIIIISFSACELNEIAPEKNDDIIFENEELDGILINGINYPTPHAVIEIWGNNIDSLSSDYDISFTDGSFDSDSRQIINNSILVYFDANSPSLENLSPGTYEIENTSNRKPWNIVDAYILVRNVNNFIKYPILSGIVTVTEEDGKYSIDYILQALVNSEETSVTGRFNGDYQIIDQTAL